MKVCTVIGLIIQTNIIYSLVGRTIFLIQNACLCKVFEGKQRVLFVCLFLYFWKKAYYAKAVQFKMFML